MYGLKPVPFKAKARTCKLEPVHFKTAISFEWLGKAVDGE